MASLKSRWAWARSNMSFVERETLGLTTPFLGTASPTSPRQAMSSIKQGTLVCWREGPQPSAGQESTSTLAATRAIVAPAKTVTANASAKTAAWLLRQRLIVERASRDEEIEEEVEAREVAREVAREGG